jgi:ABC-type transporter Mla MlaB component
MPLMMSYPWKQPLPPEQAGRVLHDDGVLRITQLTGPGLALAGEIDEDTYPALVAVLSEFAVGDEVHLDLAGLYYCDLAGLRAMVRIARAARPGSHGADTGGTRVVLQNVPPALRTVLGVVGWDAIPELIIEPPAPSCAV